MLQGKQGEGQLWQDRPSSGQAASDLQRIHIYHNKRHGGPGVAPLLLKGTFGTMDLLLLMSWSTLGPSNLPLVVQ